MNEKWITVDGIVERGHRVASGEAGDRRYPRGTLQIQKPLFKERGLDLSAFHQATLNVSIRPFTFTMLHPQFTFRKVEWTSFHPPEDFSFSKCGLVFNNARYEGWIYYPHPETKKEHYQDPSIVEIIAAFMPGLKYGDRIQILFNPAEVSVAPGA